MTAPTETTRIIAIMLGASAWPNMPSLKASSAFVRSAEQMRDYLRSTDWLGLPEHQILDLFDDTRSNNDTDMEIRRFLDDKLGDEASPITDVILYYTGHGDFTAGEQQFQLMLRSTREEQKDFTGYPMRQLAQTMSTLARDVRKYVILDCCYAAAAFQDWQMQSSNAVNTAIKKSAERQFAKQSGTALLCACNEDQWALYKDDDLTMFSGALMRTLKRGSPEFDRFMTIEEVHELVANDIREQHANESVEPVLHVPKGRREALAEIGIFPNPAQWLCTPVMAAGEPTTESAPEPTIYGFAAQADAESSTPSRFMGDFALKRTDAKPARTPKPEDVAQAPLAIERVLRLRDQDRGRAVITAIIAAVFTVTMILISAFVSMEPFGGVWIIFVVILATPFALHVRGWRRAGRYEANLAQGEAASAYLALHRDVQELMLRKRVRLFGRYFISGGGFWTSMVFTGITAIEALLTVIEGLT
ncbi:MAG: hypothetical protein FJX66_06250 [Alphaproteobacteria bacterium]|nr:hypothetical protein [Alphaproteobacteria bacterium]